MLNEEYYRSEMERVMRNGMRGIIREDNPLRMVEIHGASQREEEYPKRTTKSFDA